MSKQRWQYEGAGVYAPVRGTWYTSVNGMLCLDETPKFPYDFKPEPPLCPNCDGWCYVEVAPASDYEPAVMGECPACAGTGVAHTPEQLEATRRIQAQARRLQAAWPQQVEPPPF